MATQWMTMYMYTCKSVCLTTLYLYVRVQMYMCIVMYVHVHYITLYMYIYTLHNYAVHMAEEGMKGERGGRVGVGGEGYTEGKYGMNS